MGLIIIVVLMSEEQEQQVIQKYLFIITPLEIKSSSKIKSSSRKSILIKLGNKTAKCSELKSSVELEIEVLYSKTLHKYCPIKGIIKIYDVSEDGSEIISCVGGFQTDELLNQATSRVTLDKEIGTSKLKMDIHIINKTSKENKHPLDHKPQNKTSFSPKKYAEVDKGNSAKSSLSSQQSSVSSSNVDRGSGKRMGNPLLKLQGSKQYDLPYKNTSSSINKSLQKINQALNFKRFQDSGITTRANQVLAKAEVEGIRQQLQDEKRKTALFEDKFSKSNLKLNSCKANLAYLHGQIKSYMEASQKVLDCMQIVQGAPVAQIDPSQQSYSFKYKQTAGVQRAFQEFVSFLLRKTNEPLPQLQLDFESVEASRSLLEVEQNKKELTILKKLATEKDKKIVSLERQIEGAEITIRNLKQTNRHLGEENRYLRQKNEQIEMSLYHKENTIESLNGQIEKLNEETQQIDNKLYNSTLEIEELREQVSNCNETIDKYRVKYGDLKNVKNRAIEMEIKECLRWIELQNRDMEMSEIDETVPSEHEHESDRGDSLSEVIRNIQIEKMPKQEMSIIRDQLLRILQKVDNLMGK